MNLVKNSGYLIGLIAVWLSLTARAWALGGLDETAAKAGFNDKDLLKLSGNALNIVLSFVGVLFLMVIMAGGWMWLVSGGQSAKVALAQKLIAAGVIGLVIVVAAYAIAVFIGGSLDLNPAL